MFLSSSELVVEPTRTILLFKIVLSLLTPGGTTETGTELLGTVRLLTVESITLSFLFIYIWMAV